MTRQKITGPKPEAQPGAQYLGLVGPYRNSILPATCTLFYSWTSVPRTRSPRLCMDFRCKAPVAANASSSRSTSRVSSQTGVVQTQILYQEKNKTEILRPILRSQTGPWRPISCCEIIFISKFWITWMAFREKLDITCCDTMWASLAFSVIILKS